MHINNNPEAEGFEPGSLASGNSIFALDLYRQISPASGNLFFSPYSISSALAMTCAGARGETQHQMVQTLRFPVQEETLHQEFKSLREILHVHQGGGKNQLLIANALWPQKGYKLSRPYRNLLKKYYGVKLKALDFAESENARAEINNWVAEKTESKILDLIGAGVLDSLTRLVLINAIYFKGAWQHPFAVDQTWEEPFHSSASEEAQVQMMHKKVSLRYCEDELAQVLELPYAGDDLSMLILLPREVDGVAGLENSLNTTILDKWNSSLEEAEINLTLPKFEINFPFRLDDTLVALGMVDAFNAQADFSGMDGSRELYIGAVLHKAYVSVNEEGTEAAAATAVIMQTKSIAFMAIEFKADHPFLFLIRENSTGSILFIGRLVNPV